MKQCKERELFENSPIMKAVIKLAMPTVIGQIILVIYNAADTFFIGLTGSDAMITAVSIGMPAFMVLSAISNLFGIGGASVISRALGIRDDKRASAASAFAFWGCLLMAAVYAGSVRLLMHPFVRLLGGSDEVVHTHAVKYLTITVVLGGVITALSTLFSHLIRSEGKSIHASVGIALGGILNIALDPLFMFVIMPRGEEILGAAVATALSNLASLCYFIIVLRRNKHSALDIRFTPCMLHNGIPAAVLGCGLPACLMTLFENISFAVLDNLMALNGVMMQAGIAVAKKVNMLAHCIVRGMAQGVLPLISYNYASGNLKRMKQTISISMSISILLAMTCMCASILFGRQLVALFLQGGTDSVVYGARFLRILSIGCPFSACAYAIISFFQAVGCGVKSFVLAILRKGLLDIPMMFILNGSFVVDGIVMATPLADIICCAAAVCLFASFLHEHNIVGFSFSNKWKGECAH